MTPDKFQELLAKARKRAMELAEENSVALTADFSSVSETVTAEKPHSIDLSKVGIPDSALTTEEGQEAAVDFLSEVIPKSSDSKGVGGGKQDAGVTRDVTLNAKQQEFVTTILNNDDCCLIGAAGTGKTTCTGKAIKALIDANILHELGTQTKWLRSDVPGVLITSFTRKAVNNIKRAIPDKLKPHVLTLHKVLEFAPVFNEIVDPNDPTKLKKTMTFEPQRTATNPLPRNLSLVIFEESSMIGTDLYNYYAAATPHNPQEVFIGDINQLPPIFGPAILGFKMALLPVVQLDEVYRQALLSPIIRLAHAVLSGDTQKFLPTVVTKEEMHPHLHKMMSRKSVPSLEKFDEVGEHGSVKIQIWQKTLPEDIGVRTTAQQFIAWIQSGYYNPDEDLILCPFNKAFGTVELNKRIHNYLGLQRGAVVHEVIAGFNTYYLAPGDRVLYDKEDAFILDIARNPSYLGKSPRPAAKHLDRWGIYQEQISDEEMVKATIEDEAFSLEAIDKFMDDLGTGEDDKESRVNAASHEITIRFAFTDEVIKLSGASEINNLIGGHAITVYKAQGSEAGSVFLVLHKSHAVAINNEMLYTAITRARNKLHIICEPDHFFKAVKTHKVKGRGLAEKISFFQGKVEFKEMQVEMEFLKKQRDAKKLLRVRYTPPPAETSIPISEVEQKVAKSEAAHSHTDLIVTPESITDSLQKEDIEVAQLSSQLQVLDTDYDADGVRKLPDPKPERNVEAPEAPEAPEAVLPPKMSLAEKLAMLKAKARGS